MGLRAPEADIDELAPAQGRHSLHQNPTFNNCVPRPWPVMGNLPESRGSRGSDPGIKVCKWRRIMKQRSGTWR